jgi:hypothetical protein
MLVIFSVSRLDDNNMSCYSWIPIVAESKLADAVTVHLPSESSANSMFQFPGKQFQSGALLR